MKAELLHIYIDDLIANREQLRRENKRPSASDDATLLKLLLKDAQENPENYARH